MKIPKISYKTLLYFQIFGFLTAIATNFILHSIFLWLAFFVLMFIVQRLYIEQNLKLSDIEKAAESPLLRRMMLNKSFVNESWGLILISLTAILTMIVYFIYR